MIFTPKEITIINKPISKQYLSVTVKNGHYYPKKSIIDYIRPSSRNKEGFDESDAIYCIGIILDECLHGERYDGLREYECRTTI